jgi:succinate dehydrogenase / fumarate reductase iron-sulfur subunit
MRFRVYRFDPDRHARPLLQDYDLALEPSDRMLLDALERLRQQDDSLAYRRSCREGVCGSDAMNINGRNALACITPLEGLREPVTLAPLPGFPVIRDLVVDMTQFFAHYHAIRPYLVNEEPPPNRERLQSPEERAQLNGLYECILCACCTSFCPPSWWNPDKFLGPAALLQAQRFLADSRDRAGAERLAFLDDVYKLYRCRTIMNCTEVCPKGLSPARAIEQIKVRLLRS